MLKRREIVNAFQKFWVVFSFSLLGLALGLALVLPPFIIKGGDQQVVISEGWSLAIDGAGGSLWVEACSPTPFSASVRRGDGREVIYRGEQGEGDCPYSLKLWLYRGDTLKIIQGDHVELQLPFDRYLVALVRVPPAAALRVVGPVAMLTGLFLWLGMEVVTLVRRRT